jgi:hypothetical protein
MARARDSCQARGDIPSHSARVWALLRLNNIRLKSEQCGTDNLLLRLASSGLGALCSVIVRIKQLVTLIGATVKSMPQSKKLVG